MRSLFLFPWIENKKICNEILRLNIQFNIFHNRNKNKPVHSLKHFNLHILRTQYKWDDVGTLKWLRFCGLLSKNYNYLMFLVI